MKKKVIGWSLIAISIGEVFYLTAWATTSWKIAAIFWGVIIGIIAFSALLALIFSLVVRLALGDPFEYEDLDEEDARVKWIKYW